MRKRPLFKENQSIHERNVTGAASKQACRRVSESEREKASVLRSSTRLRARERWRLTTCAREGASSMFALVGRLVAPSYRWAHHDRFHCRHQRLCS